MAHPQKVEDKDTCADIAGLRKKLMPLRKQVDLTQIKEVSGCGGSKTFKVAISQASKDVVPRSRRVPLSLRAQQAAYEKSETSQQAVRLPLIAEAKDLRWSINEWTGEAIVERYTR